MRIFLIINLVESGIIKRKQFTLNLQRKQDYKLFADTSVYSITD